MLPRSVIQPGSPAMQGAARRPCRCIAALGASTHRHEPQRTASLCPPPSAWAVLSQQISCTQEARATATALRRTSHPLQVKHFAP